MSFSSWLIGDLVDNCEELVTTEGKELVGESGNRATRVENKAGASQNLIDWGSSAKRGDMG
jgi:hypothetical protein